jgi:hypothetical protein
LQRTNRLSVRAAFHALMAIAVLLPSIFASLISVAIAAFDGTLPEKIRELAICVVARETGNQFE